MYSKVHAKILHVTKPLYLDVIKAMNVRTPITFLWFIIIISVKAAECVTLSRRPKGSRALERPGRCGRVCRSPNQSVIKIRAV